ncbi:MAG TPA: nucleotidyltransferase domain-containing protein [Gemmatimonadales bacterium]|nr:nucleotidyltransferase domain-containing protein [Gemmatimonadales bacterium]
MNDAVERVVTPFLAAADAALGAGYSALLYGSAARGDYIAGRSDINLMLVLDDPSPTRLRALAPAFSAWQKAASEPPLLISRAEWQRASDVFPLEITDMRAGYQVLRGSDPLGAARVAQTDLRQALERELRGKLLRLRQGYAAAAGDEKALGALASASAGTILVLLRSLLALTGRPVPTSPAILATEAATLIGAPAAALARPVERRGERNWRCTAREFEEYMDAVANAAGYVDQLQLGDQ